MSTINRLEWDAYIRDSELMASINRIEQRVNRMANNVTNRGRDLEEMFTRLAKVAGGFLSLNAAENFVQKLIQVRSEFQQLEIAFTTMLGSKERADKLTKDLIEFAGTTPFGMKDTANAAKQLLAYGSTAENVKNELRMLGDVAAGTSQPIGDLVYLYGTLRTQGRAYLMDIRQFAGRGIPIYEELAKVLKINKSEVNDFVSAGKVGFEEVQQAFQNMTAAGSMFGGLMEAQSRTIQGELERLGDAFDQMLNKIGKDSEGVISGVIQAGSVLVENYEIVLNVITGLISVYGAYRAALISTAALQQLVAARAVGMTVAEMLHYGAIVLKTKAMVALNAVMAANPVILMTAGIIALSSAIYALTQVTNATSAAQEKLAEAYSAGVDRADQEKRSVEQLIGVIKDNTASVEERKAAYEKLQAQTKGVLASFSQEEIAIGKATKALDSYIVSIGRAASARKAFDEFNALAEQLDVINRKGIDGIGIWERAGRGIQNLFGANGAEAAKLAWGFGDKRGEDLIVEQQKDVIKQQMNALQKEFGKEFTAYITGVENTVKESGVVDVFANSLKDPLSNFNTLLKSATNKADLDKIKKALTEKMEALAPGNSDIAKYKSKLEQLAKVEKQYSIGGNEKAANQEFQEAERYLSILSDISKSKQAYLNSQLTRDQQEIQSVKDKYKTLIDEIDKFNRNPKNTTKITAAQIQSITGVRDQEINDTIYRLQTDKKLKAYQEDYANFIKYEELKKKHGEGVAEQQLGTYRTTIEKISGEYAGLLAKQKMAGLTRVESERFQKLGEMLTNHTKKVNDDNINLLSEAIEASKTLNDKLLDIEKEYLQKVKSLRENAKGKDTTDQEKILFNQLTEKYANEIESSTEFQKAMKNIDSAIGSMIGGAYRHGKDVVFGLIDGIKGATDSQKEELRKIFGKFFDDGAKNADIGNLQFIAQASLGFADLAKSASDFAFGLAEGMDILTNMVNTAGQLASAFAGLSNNKETQKALQQAGSYFAIFGGVVSLLSGITKSARQSTQKQSKELQDQLAYQNDRQLKSTEAITKMLERQLELMDKIYGAERLEKYGKTLKQIEDNYKDLNRQLEGRYLMTGNKDKDDILTRLNNGETEKQIRKSFRGDAVGLAKALSVLEHLDRFAKTSSIADLSKDISKAKEELAKLQYQADLGNVDDYTRKLIDQLQNQIDLYTETVNKLKEETTGNSFSTILSNLSDLFFNSGLDSADAWSKGFDSVMKNYAIQKFSRDYLEKAAQDWYDLFDSLAEGGITDSERDSLKKAWDKIQQDGQKRVDELGKIIGNDNSSSLKSSIQRDMTEATGSELTGLFRSDFELQKRGFDESKIQGINIAKQLQIANSSLTVLNAIQYNTGEAVKRLDSAVSELQSLNKNLGMRF